tara:strand:+ start:17497 stop:18222 length:726 start_codon:yes stop_codon:yes gene_type:complete
MSRENILLETKGLTKRFGGVSAVENVNFKIFSKELRCLIGPNGAGKSTFFRCLTHQEKSSSGQIFFKERDITKLHTHQISDLGIGIKTQIPSVFDAISVRENIWLAASRFCGGRSADELTDSIMEKVGVTHLRSSLVGQLSHGDRQWVEIGMVLSGNPELILLDEPTAGMTKQETEKTAYLVQEIKKSASLIIVEHDMHFVRSIADIVTVFHQGTILAEGKVDVIMNNSLVRDVYLGKKGA